MKRFRLKADITFDAEDLDDAFAQLEAHFKYVPMEGDEGGHKLQFLGEMNLEPDRSDE